MNLDWINAPANLRHSTEDSPITNLMHLIWLSRPDLRNAFDLDTDSGQRDFLNWFRTSAEREYGIDSDSLEENAHSHDTANAPVDRHRKGDKGMYWTLLNIEAHLARFGRHAPDWLRLWVKRFWHSFLSSFVRRQSRVRKHQITVSSNTAGKSIRNKTQLHLFGEPGVNLVGYAHAELGMGEHVRMSAAAFGQTSVPYGIYNFNHGVPTRHKATIEHGSLMQGNPFWTNIFHINADQMLRAFCALGGRFFSNRYNIGYWTWELAVCPDEWVPVMGFVDEIWAPSRFVQQAFSEKAKIPVKHMPLCVTLPDSSGLERRDFRLPENAYLFLFTFDFNSYIERKNPFASIRAFQQAFQDRRHDTGLVIKAMNGSKSHPQWKRMMNMIGDDDRIYVFDETMDRNSLLGLKGVCNCYVSLHRSEGFGRGPAEAMYLGKSVIVTNYSGNTDYSREDNSCLVNYSLIPIEENQYPFSNRQVWAEPDIEHAAWYMRKLVTDPSYGIELGKRAKAFIHDNFNPRRIGAIYQARLRELGLFDTAR